MIHYEPLVWQHIREATALGWGGWEKWSDARLRYLPMLGYAARNDAGDLIGVGGIFWIGKTAHACLALTPEFVAHPRSRWVHRQALEVISLAHRLSPVIVADADLTVRRSQEFLERLGFKTEDGEHWTHGVYGAGSAGGGLIRDEQCLVDRVAGGSGD